MLYQRVNCYVNGAISGVATKTVFHSCRWMGATIAVYDCGVQAKAASGFEKTHRRRRVTPRSGNRRSKSRPKNRRKCRAVVRCDPVVSMELFDPEVVMTEGMLKEARATLRVRHRLKRNAYHDERYKSWAQKRVNFIGGLLKKFNRVNNMVPEGYERMYSGLAKVSAPTKDQQWVRITRAKERLVTASSKRSGDSKDFTILRLNLLIKLATGETLDSLLEYKGNTHGGRMAHRRKMEAARSDEILGGVISLEHLKASPQQGKGLSAKKNRDSHGTAPRWRGSLANYNDKLRDRKSKEYSCSCIRTRKFRHAPDCESLRSRT